MEPTRYGAPNRHPYPTPAEHSHRTEHPPVTPSRPVTRAIPTGNTPPNPAQPVRRNGQKKSGNGKLSLSGKRFFGQFLIDHWVLRVNGEQKNVPFGKGKLTLDLPAGVYQLTAFTPYLGMHCMRATAEAEVRPGQTTKILYQTVFDIFKNGKLLNESAANK